MLVKDRIMNKKDVFYDLFVVIEVYYLLSMLVINDYDGRKIIKMRFCVNLIN